MRSFVAAICLAIWVPVVVSASENPLAGVSFEVPKTWPCAELSGVDYKAIWLDGESRSGMPTRVFAYVVMPNGASAARKVPGVVLAHGGLGTAYLGWAQTWAKRGYAAIAPDTCGALPIAVPNERLKWISSGVGGPHGWGRSDLAFDKVENQWPFHAVGALVRAHSYLRSLPEVETEKTGITGISWGGFLTMLTAATDTRFKFAMPVYACAFYDEMVPYGATIGKYQPEPNWTRWCSLFDPKHYAPKMTMPVMWFASTSDVHFPFDLLQRTLLLPPGMPALALRVNMNHAHGPSGENMPELFRFADSVVRGGAPLPVMDTPRVEAGRIMVSFKANGLAFKRFDLNWCTNTLPVATSPWQTKAFPVPSGETFAAPLPDNATRVYVNAVMAGETGEKTYPEALVSSPACTVRR